MIEVAKDVVVEAGEKILSLRGDELAIKNKGRVGDIVTEADIASEKIIINRLKAEFPKHNFLSEELGKIDNRSEYTWVIDPLDGTIPFSLGLENFGISVGLLRDKVPILGVINLPALKSLYWAEKKKGAYLNGEKIKVSISKELSKSIVGFDLAYAETRKQEINKLIFPIADKVRFATIMGCTVVRVCYVAGGVYEAYLHSAHPWDFVAGAVIIEEAGGKVTNYQGKPIDWSKGWIDFFASNGHLHKKILSLIK